MQREKWIDVLKGIGIACVVVGHVASAPLLVQSIFMFHMPLFFLIGGWLHHASVPQRDYWRGRAAGLLLPYASYLLILWPLELLSAYPGQAWDAAFIADFLLKPMLLGGPLLKGYAAAFWFATCYFLTQQLVHGALRRCTPNVAVLLFSSMLSCAYLQAWWWPQRWLPWNVHTVLFAAPLYYLGYRVRELDVERFALPLCMVAAGGIGLNLLGLHNRLDLKYLDYGLPLVTLASAVAWCGVLALLARRLVASLAGTALAAALQSLGAASMTIMFTHQFVQLAMEKTVGLNGTALRISTALALGWLLHRMWLRLPLLARFFIGKQTTRGSIPPASLVSGA
ncbi:MAG: acyltransferase family protein [Rugosibacter sp.]